MERIVGGHYRLRRRIGGGSFGEIYNAENTRSHKRVAVKIESVRSKVPQLAYESKLYAIFSGGTGIPRLHWYGTEGIHNIMVIDLLGKSLEDLFVQCHRRFSLKTVLMLVDQMISCVEFIHNKNFIHRDIKPDNFAMGLGSTSNQVFIIDYGLSKKYRDQHTHTHIPYVEGKSLTGTARYASVGALKGIEQSRRDDLESLGYVWLYLLRGDLPWMGLNVRDQKHKYDKICEVKSKTPFPELCKGFPEEFVKYFNYVRNLRFTEKPNYAELRQLFRDLFKKLGYIYDYKYDWNLSNSQTSNTFVPRYANPNQSKLTKESINVGQRDYEGEQQKGISQFVDSAPNKNYNNITRQNSSFVRDRTIPMHLKSRNESTQNSQRLIKEREEEKISSSNEKEKLNVSKKMPVQQFQYAGIKTTNQKRTRNRSMMYNTEGRVRQHKYSRNNENNSDSEHEFNPNTNTANIYHNRNNRNPQSALMGTTRKEREKSVRDSRYMQQAQQDSYMAHHHMHTLNSAEKRTSSIRNERNSTQRTSNNSRAKNVSGNGETSARRKPSVGGSLFNNAENSPRKPLVPYWMEDSMATRQQSAKRITYK